MITVNTPDGGTATFPDGTPVEAIKSAMAKKFGGGQKPAGSDLAALSQSFQNAVTPREGPPIPESIMQRERVKDYFTQNPESSLMSFAGGTSQGASFGLSDEIFAGLRALSPNITYDQALAFERGRMDAARQNSPVASYGGEIAGSVAVPAGAAGSFGKAALAGGASGAAYGFGAGEGGFANRAQNAAVPGALGAGVGAGASALGSLLTKSLSGRATDKAIREAARNAPTTEELRAAGNAAYKAVDDAGVSINSGVLGQKLGSIAGDLRNEGVALDVGGKVFPASRGIMDAAENFTAGKNTVPFNELDILRRYMGGAAASNIANKADTRLATKSMAALDDVVQNLKPQDIDAGDLQALQTMLPKAREIWAKMSKSQKIDDAISASQNYLSGGASGLRNQFASILRNPKLSKGFSEAEKRAMRNVIGGTIPEKFLHLAAGGMGNLLAVLGGGLGGGPTGAVVGGGIAMGLRKASESVARKNAEIARGLVANGGLRSIPQVSALPELMARRMIEGGLRPSYPPFAQTILGSPAQR